MKFLNGKVGKKNNMTKESCDKCDGNDVYDEVKVIFIL